MDRYYIMAGARGKYGLLGQNTAHSFRPAERNVLKMLLNWGTFSMLSINILLVTFRSSDGTQFNLNQLERQLSDPKRENWVLIIGQKKSISGSAPVSEYLP